MPDEDRPISLQARLRYIWTDGATKALAALGWESISKNPTCAFGKKIGARIELIVFQKPVARGVVTQGRMIDVLENSTGITYKEFEQEYIKVYDGTPPLMPL